MRDEKYTKSEDLIHSLSGIDSRYIEEADPVTIEKTGTEERKNLITKVTHRRTKAAAVAIVAVCVLALSGGVVWAMTASPIKDIFFKGSDKEFEQVYTEVGKEFIIGNHKVVYEGSSFDESVENGYVHLSFWDLDGNPVDMTEGHQNWDEAIILSRNQLNRYIYSCGVNIAGDRMYIITLYGDSQGWLFRNNNMYLHFSRDEADPEFDLSGFYKDKPFRFLLLDAEQWTDIKNEVEELDFEELITYTPVFDEVTGFCVDEIPNFPEDYIQPEVLDILEKYDPNEVKGFKAETQIIEIEGMKFEIGRMSMIMYYHWLRCPIDEFVFRREDGREYKAVRDKNMWRFEENKDDPTVYCPNLSVRENSGNMESRLMYGFILGINEKVTIEVNGEIYE